MKTTVSYLISKSRNLVKMCSLRINIALLCPINPLAPGRYDTYFEIFNLITQSSSLGTRSEISRKWMTLRWRHNGCDSVSNHQPHHCLLNRLFRCRSKKTSKLRATGLCAGNSPGTGEFPAQMASSAENVSIWWRHHDTALYWWEVNISSGSGLVPSGKKPLSEPMLS